MPFSNKSLSKPRPEGVQENLILPRRQQSSHSPVDWRDEVLYFLLVDRFSDANEATRPLLDRANPAAARPALPDGTPWRWDRWAESGAGRWQGGTLAGVISKLDYLKRLGVTTLWLSPVFKQRGHRDDYHGYGVQDFLDVDLRFGTRDDLVALVKTAHAKGLRVILDIIFNHSGPNWLYPHDTPGGTEQPHYTSGRYAFGAWLDENGHETSAIHGADDAVWPRELQDAEHYTRAGCGSLGAGDINDAQAEHKRSDFLMLRDFRLEFALDDLARCFKYWIALTNCDGFRIDTLKHVSLEEARNFCGSIKEFAANQGKENFFLVGEIAGGDYGEDRYLDVLDRNLNAALDIGEMRPALTGVAKGLLHPGVFFGGFDAGNAVMGSHRNLGNRHVSILDDHDHVFGQKLRFSSESASDHQVAAGVAMQAFTLGIPCVYYGTEQALAGPEAAERIWLPDWSSSDRYLRETMFGPTHPRGSGRAGIPDSNAGASLDTTLPGFGPFGTAGKHCFDERSAAYLRIAAILALRKQTPCLRHGRQYQRPISFLGRAFNTYGPGELIAWSRILDDEEFVCVVNGHGNAARGADVLVDANLNPPGSTMQVVLNSAQAGSPTGYDGPHALRSSVPVRRTAEGIAYIEIRDLPASEVVVLANRPKAEVGGVSA